MASTGREITSDQVVLERKTGIIGVDTVNTNTRNCGCNVEIAGFAVTVITDGIVGDRATRIEIIYTNTTDKPSGISNNSVISELHPIA